MNVVRKKICVVNGKRGGFNALLPTMRAIEAEPSLELQVLLTDMHLSEQFGYTLEYAKRYISIARTVPLNQTGGTARERVEALGRGLSGLAGAFDDLKPDIVLLLGDRSETLVAAFAALQLGIPVAHIQGGEVSGNLDGIQRHAITKLAHLHFTETERARRTVLHLGEERWRVQRVGAPYLDFIFQKLYTPEQEVRAKFNLQENEPFLLILQHPETRMPERSRSDMEEILSAVEATSLRAVVAYPCSDQGYEGIIEAIETRRGNPQFSIHKNIPAEDFIGLQACASVLVGNSSAAIYEAPYLYLPSVSVGSRQRKRERENNIIDVLPERRLIKKAIDTARFDVIFRKKLHSLRRIYGDGKAHKRIVNALRKAPPRARLFKKSLTHYSIKRQLFDRYVKPLTDRLRA
ncbi:MAG: hypothetical protein G01um101417_326 [Parcubacteria group bacterium Gr01-1014_17]|nr:MAG: hypothetical protein G01um101417_326 [Parcubacteria group bacterium Gr01-1014_17]